MKKTLATFIVTALLIAGFISGCKSKKTDTEITTSAQTSLQANPDYSAVTVVINDGVATLNGQVKDEATKTAAEKAVKDVKGVKSVTNNLTIAAPVDVAADEPLTLATRDAIKDHPGVNANVSGGVITLTGEIKRADLPTLMQKLNALNPLKIENNLVIK